MLLGSLNGIGTTTERLHGQVKRKGCPEDVGSDKKEPKVKERVRIKSHLQICGNVGESIGNLRQREEVGAHKVNGAQQDLKRVSP